MAGAANWLMKIRVMTVSILFLGLVLSAAASESGSGTGFLEPIVTRHAGVLPPDACRELIALGESKGFNVDVESIDDDEDDDNKVSSQSIEVFERDDGVTSPAIWRALEPFIPQLTELVKNSIDTETDRHYFPDRPDRVPQLGWVFFRKYSPNSARQSLKLHVDSNMHTLNIALNDDFDGGSIFYVKPPVLQIEEAEDDRPDIPFQYKSYDWINNLKRENTSDIIFPTLDTGDVLIYNFTVWHAVAPLDAGTRYSFVLFYDMDNPAIQGDFKDFDDDDYDDDIDDDHFKIAFYHEIEDVEIDLVFIDETHEGDAIAHVMEEKLPPFEEIQFESYDGHVFQAVISGTDAILSEFVISHDQSLYRIVKGDGINDKLVKGDGINDEL